MAASCASRAVSCTVGRVGGIRSGDSTFGACRHGFVVNWMAVEPPDPRKGGADVEFALKTWAGSESKVSV